jgi:CRP-like cAMP-binding protein
VLLPYSGRAMPSRKPITTSNRILSRLSPADFALLESRLTAVELPLRKQLEIPQKPITYVYFIESGFASVVANGNNKQSIEVGLIGREGMTGLAVIMGTDRTHHETFMQCAGRGWRISAQNVRDAMEKSTALRNRLLQYGHAFHTQTTYTAIANGRSKIEERLARWILMAHDRVEADSLPLTHEFLSLMLGVQRPGVTIALNLLEKDGLIRASRGAITVTDRQGLEQLSNGAYGKAEAEFPRLFG